MANEYYNVERRQHNMDKVLKAVNNLDMDFNSMMFAFADIMQSMFMNGVFAGVERQEQERIKQEAVDLTNTIAEVLNDQGKTQAVDMIALTGLIMDAVEIATQRALEYQEEQDKQE